MIVRKIIVQFFCVCLLVLSVAAVAAAANSTNVIETIEVRVVPWQEDHPISDKIAKRMQASVYTIGDNVLNGHAITEIVNNKLGYEVLIQDVFNRILVGYSVQKVDLELGKNTIIKVVVYPWHNVIHDVNVDVEISGISEAVKPLAMQDIQGLETVFLNVLQELPIDAIEWVNGILRTGVNEFVSSRLPEFNASFALVTDDHNKVNVKVDLYPKGQLIRETNLQIQSNTIPNTVRLLYRPELNKQIENLVGLPVKFVQRHQDYFIDRLNLVTLNNKNLQKYKVESKVEMLIANQTQVFYTMDSSKYILTVEGYLDVGKDEKNTSVKAHAGRMLNKTNELFLEMDFFPHQMEWDFYPGILHSLTSKTKIGFKYDIEERRGIFLANQILSDRFQARVEHVPSTKFTEFGLRYHLHDFFDVEYVINDDEKWLRLIGVL